MFRFLKFWPFIAVEIHGDTPAIRKREYSRKMRKVIQSRRAFDNRVDQLEETLRHRKDVNHSH